MDHQNLVGIKSNCSVEYRTYDVIVVRTHPFPKFDRNERKLKKEIERIQSKSKLIN